MGAPRTGWQKLAWTYMKAADNLIAASAALHRAYLAAGSDRWNRASDRYAADRAAYDAAKSALKEAAKKVSP